MANSRAKSRVENGVIAVEGEPNSGATQAPWQSWQAPLHSRNRSWELAHRQECDSGTLARRHKKVIDPINLNFVPAYARFLAAYTDLKVPLTDQFFDWRSEIERIVDEPPDMYGVIETLSKTGKVTPPKKHAGDWVDDKVANGLKYRKESVTLSEVDWQALYREAYNIYFLFEDAAQHASNQRRKTTAQEATAKALKLAVLAGQIAAYQDILAFVVHTSFVEDQQGKQPTDVWEEWKNVAVFHRAVFGEDVTSRHHNYIDLIDPNTLTVSIPPFGDYGDWAN